MAESIPNPEWMNAFSKLQKHLTSGSSKDLMVFSGNSNLNLACEIVNHLGIPLGKAEVGRFSDGEVRVEIKENVRGKDVFVIQPTSSPTNENLMELLVMIDALKRSSSRSIHAVIPYYGYARQDRRSRSVRVPISAKLVAKMIEQSGVDSVLVVDVHSEQIQGFFDKPIDNIYAMPVMVDDVMNQNYQNIVVVSPDVGGVVRARELAKKLNDADLAIIDKRRPNANVSEVMNIIGDVNGKECVMIDDMVDTAGTLCHAAEALKKRGAVKVVAYCTHPVLSGNALLNLNSSIIDELVVTNTIQLSSAALSCTKIRQLSIAPLLAETIRRISQCESVSSLFKSQI